MDKRTYDGVDEVGHHGDDEILPQLSNERSGFVGQLVRKECLLLFLNCILCELLDFWSDVGEKCQYELYLMLTEAEYHKE